MGLICSSLIRVCRPVSNPAKKRYARYDPDRHGYRIYIGNLCGSESADQLTELFLPFGPVVDVWLARLVFLIISCIVCFLPSDVYYSTCDILQLYFLIKWVAPGNTSEKLLFCILPEIIVIRP